MKTILRLNINQETQEVYTSVHKTLLEVLREDLGLTGTKHGCELGECGLCTVLIDGEPVLSCLVLPVEVQGKEMITIEGVAEDGHLHPLQAAFADLGAAQCGFCTPAMVLTARHYLEQQGDRSRQEIMQALSGVLCRCTGYTKIIDAVIQASDEV